MLAREWVEQDPSTESMSLHEKDIAATAAAYGLATARADAGQVQIYLEPGGDRAVCLAVRICGGELMSFDADNDFIPMTLQLERGNASLFDYVEDALEMALGYATEQIKAKGWTR